MTELGLIFGISVLGLAFAGYLARWILQRPAGDAEMARVAARIRAAAEGFIRRQSGTIGAVSAVLGGAIFLAYGLLRRHGEAEAVSALELGVWLTLSFALGAASAVAVAHVATWIATRANVRAAIGARRSLDLALQIAIRGGAVVGLFIVAQSLLAMAGLFAAVFAYKGGFGPDPAAALELAPNIPVMIAGYALGASFAALLAQLGGGAFGKAADLAADIAGHEAGLAQDDAQNPATIADLAGDDVGDCAGRGAGLFASTVAETLGAMILGAALWRDNHGLPSVTAVVLFPLVTRAFGVLGAMFGVMVVKTDDREDPLSALARGLYVTALLHAVGLAGAAKWLLGAHWLAFFACGAVGIAVGVSFLHLTQYYTDARFRPVRELAEVSRGGPTLTVLGGLATGLESAVAPLVLVVAASLGAYEIGGRTGLVGGGLFGTAVATMGMLGVAGYVLAMDAFGPIVDNAGGIVEMTVARDRPDVRGRTIVLDAVGNTTKALTKAYAAGAAALGSLLLVAAYLAEVERRAAGMERPAGAPRPAGLELQSPLVFLGALVGLALVLWFMATCIGNVTRSARRLIEEVRRQLRHRPRPAHDASSDPGDRTSPLDPLTASGRTPSGVPAAAVGGASRRSVEPGSVPPADLGGRAPPFVPDHEACVELVARSALRQMIAPALVAAAVPVAVGLALRFARTEDNPLIAANSVAALLMAGTIAGVLGTLLLGNAGGAWDNAKKYIETGAHGGRYLVDETGARADSPTYSAALIGDTVGDPLKDTAGPAIHVLVKMLPIITLVFLPFFL